jgi:hypothetical protein
MQRRRTKIGPFPGSEISGFAINASKEKNMVHLETWEGDDRGVLHFQTDSAMLSNGSVIVNWGWLPVSTSTRSNGLTIGTFGVVIDPVQWSPLNSRAWTFQERILSRRILHFALGQVYWQCRYLFEGKDNSRYLTTMGNADTVVLQQRCPTKDRGMQSSVGVSLVEGISPYTVRTRRQYQGWLSAVEIYSERLMTYPKDKLPALSGLARYVSRATGETYHAGL